MRRLPVSSVVPLAVALLCAHAAVGQSADACFCCNNCLFNYFTDMPKGQEADARYRQQDFQGCVEESNRIRTPTGYQKVLHAKCLE